jgi:hypothetical protein
MPFLIVVIFYILNIDYGDGAESEYLEIFDMGYKILVVSDDWEALQPGGDLNHENPFKTPYCRAVERTSDVL